jgi:hypothetical protein
VRSISPIQPSGVQLASPTRPPRRTTRSSTALAEGPLVGRSQAFGRLVELYYAVRQGRSQLVVARGEAGIGKNRLANELLSWAMRQGVDVLRGRAFEAGGRLPYQPLVDALRPRFERENAPEDLLDDVWLAGACGRAKVYAPWLSVISMSSTSGSRSLSRRGVLLPRIAGYGQRRGWRAWPCLVGAVLPSLVQSEPVAQHDQARVEGAAAATGKAAHKGAHLRVIEHECRIGPHGSILLSSTARRLTQDVA